MEDNNLSRSRMQDLPEKLFSRIRQSVPCLHFLYLKKLKGDLTKLQNDWSMNVGKP